MSLAFQSAADIDRHFASQPRRSRFRKRSALSHWTEPHGFRLMEFPPRRAIMNFREIDILGINSRLGIGLMRKALSDIGCVDVAVGARTENGRSDPHRPRICQFFKKF